MMVKLLGWDTSCGMGSSSQELEHQQAHAPRAGPAAWQPNYLHVVLVHDHILKGDLGAWLPLPCSTGGRSPSPSFQGDEDTSLATATARQRDRIHHHRIHQSHLQSGQNPVPPPSNVCTESRPGPQQRVGVVLILMLALKVHAVTFLRPLPGPVGKRDSAMCAGTWPGDDLQALHHACHSGKVRGTRDSYPVGPCPPT